MPKPSKTVRGASSAPHPTGIFGPDWFKWRGATLKVELEGEAPFTARLDCVIMRGASDPADQQARLTVLDPQGRPLSVRLVGWPPAGTVRVVRAP